MDNIFESVVSALIAYFIIDFYKNTGKKKATIIFNYLIADKTIKLLQVTITAFAVKIPVSILSMSRRPALAYKEKHPDEFRKIDSGFLFYHRYIQRPTISYLIPVAISAMIFFDPYFQHLNTPGTHAFIWLFSLIVHSAFYWFDKE